MKKLIVILCIFSASVMYGQDVFIETGLNLTKYNYKDPQGNKNDNISPDEHDPKILEKYCNFASTELKIEVSEIEEIVNEAFLYLKMQQTTDIDPVKEGDRFAAGFS